MFKLICQVEDFHADPMIVMGVGILYMQHKIKIRFTDSTLITTQIEFEKIIGDISCALEHYKAMRITPCFPFS